MLRFFVKNASVDLKPSFVRTVNSYLVFVVLFGLPYFIGASVKHGGKEHDALISLIIIPAALGSLIWFFFVPHRLEFSNTDIAIKPALGSLRTLRWDELEYFGPG